MPHILAVDDDRDVLALLRQQKVAPLSGEAVSRALGVRRAAAGGIERGARVLGERPGVRGEGFSALVLLCFVVAGIGSGPS